MYVRQTSAKHVNETVTLCLDLSSVPMYHSCILSLIVSHTEILQSHLVKRLTTVLLQAQAMQKAHLDVMKARLNAVELSLMDIDPSIDQSLFIDHNIRPFTAPADWSFEPCVTHYDTVGAYC